MRKNKLQKRKIGYLLAIVLPTVLISTQACDKHTVEDKKTAKPEVNDYELQLSKIGKKLEKINQAGVNKYDYKLSKLDEKTKWNIFKTHNLQRPYAFNEVPTMDYLKTLSIKIPDDVKAMLLNLPKDYSVDVDKESGKTNLVFKINVKTNTGDVFSKTVETKIIYFFEVGAFYSTANGILSGAANLFSKYVTKSKKVYKNFRNLSEATEQDFSEFEKETLDDGSSGLGLIIDDTINQFVKDNKIKIVATKKKLDTRVTFKFTQDDGQGSLSLTKDIDIHSRLDVFPKATVLGNENFSNRWNIFHPKLNSSVSVRVDLVSKLAAIDVDRNIIWFINGYDVGIGTSQSSHYYSTNGHTLPDERHGKFDADIQSPYKIYITNDNKVLAGIRNRSVVIFNYSRLLTTNKLQASSLINSDFPFFFSYQRNGFYSYNRSTNKIIKTVIHYDKTLRNDYYNEEVPRLISYEFGTSSLTFNDEEYHVFQTLMDWKNKDNYVFVARYIPPTYNGSGPLSTVIHKLDLNFQPYKGWSTVKIDKPITCITRDEEGYYWGLGEKGIVVLIDKNGNIVDEYQIADFKNISISFKRVEPLGKNGVVSVSTRGHLVKLKRNAQNKIELVEKDAVFYSGASGASKEFMTYIQRDSEGYYYVIWPTDTNTFMKWVRLNKNADDVEFKLVKE